MPFKSKAQTRKFYGDPKLRKYAEQWASETPDLKTLPERKSKMEKKKRGKMKMKMNLKRGALHKQMGIAMDEMIPVADLKRAKKSANTKTRKRANFALVARTWNKGKSGKKQPTFKRPGA